MNIKYIELFAGIGGLGAGFKIAGATCVFANEHDKYAAQTIECEGNPRRLTPRECARLMGFDSGRSANFKIPVSDTQAYKQFGNAVVVPVSHAIATAVLPCLQSSI